MKKIYYSIPILLFLVAVLLYFNKELGVEDLSKTAIHGENLSTEKNKSIKSKADKPGEFYKYFQAISTRAGQDQSEYKENYRYKELRKAQSILAKGVKNKNAKTNATEVTSRGPGNVGGRTRAIVIDPDDASSNTWFAGAASGGVWKTEDAGSSWTNITPDLPNLATNSMAMSASNTDVIYVGTGELFAGNYAFVRGDGIFKSTDKGVTWQQLSATAGDSDFNSVNRIVIDPTDQDIVVVCTNTGVYKSIDGGVSWVQKFDSGTNEVQDLDADPSDFNIQYAGVKTDGVYKSIDGGETWSKSSDGISTGDRFEIAVSSTNTSKVYTSTYSSTDETLIYKSSDKGDSWALAKLQSGVDGNFLGEQGWYDNIIAVHPFDEDIIFVGGVYVGKYTTENTVSLDEATFSGVDLENTSSFLNFVSFSASEFNGQLEVGDGSNPSTEFSTVEVRFGPGLSQKAHRFTVPSDGGSGGDGGAGVPDTDYSYADYVDVPFEVWDITNNKQLMVSFRDQEDDGTFNLNPRDDDNDPNLLTAREYLFVHNVDYSATADSNITPGAGTHLFNNMYFFWPILADGGTFPPASSAIMRIKFEEVPTVESTASIVSDPRGDFGGINGNLHADHHNLIMIPVNAGTGEFKILNGNDGGLGLSSDGGDTWEQIKEGYITTQFYGAAKKPGSEEYIGGMQDNGTWRSPAGSDASSTSQFTEVLGGDGFEVIWHAQDPDKLMGSIYNNRIYRSTTGGETSGDWQAAQNGINTAEGPFITRLATSRTSPDVVYAVSSTGVLKTIDFGGSWSLTPLSVADNWTFENGGSPVASSQHDVEVSLANDQIVWAGGGMSDDFRKMFVSTDAGETFESVTDFPGADLGAISGLATHPTDENTAYVLFSFAGSPKILRTTDLGVTWEDISGFDTNGSVSDNGFPDVFVHSLLVLPNETNTIWAGTEIGLFESTDNGATWNYADIGLPAVSIWTMSVVDDKVVFGTHGRGIWTATIPEVAYPQLIVKEGAYLGNKNVSLELDLPVQYDEVKIFVNDVLNSTLSTVTAGSDDYEITIEPTLDSKINVSIEGSIDGGQYMSPNKEVEVNFQPTLTAFTQDTQEITKLSLALTATEEYDSIQFYLNGNYQSSQSDIQLGEVTEEFTILEAGAYEAHVIAFYEDLGFESTASFNLNVSTVTGLLERPDVREFNAYPNPVSSRLTFEIPERLNESFQVSVIGAGGKKYDSYSMNSFIEQPVLDLSYLKKGVYILKLSDDNHTFTKRIIKN